ncbi:MAG: hypothetical protein GEU87_01385 [Alphaproteobacteria bacterium]|nr:hypothetical protein [Alphaproteobacteria bacterium]
MAIDVDLAAEKFRNHWLGKAGQHGRKLDWAATWRNWIIGDFERGGGRAGGTGGRRAGGQASDFELRRRLAAAATRGGTA